VTAFLESFTAKDLGVFIEDQDFVAVQDHTEEFTQEITWRGAYGTDGPILRSVRNADEHTFSFSAVLTKKGMAAGLGDLEAVRNLRDFSVKIVYDGGETAVYTACNWRRISRRGSLTEVMLDFDIAIPGFTGS
jgi:hypothetical protein